MKTITAFFIVIILHNNFDASHCYTQTTQKWSKYQFGELDVSADMRGMSRIVLINQKIAYGIGEKFFRTDDGGVSWKTVEYPKLPRLYSQGIDYQGGQLMYLANSMVYVSNDTGGTWSASNYLESSDSIPLLYSACIKILKKDHAVIGGRISQDNSRIIKTTDGGTTWIVASIPDSTPLINEIAFVSDAVGIACTYSGHILRTTDAGNTWDKVYQNNARDLWGCEFGPTGIGTVSGTNSTILMTIDSGATWKIIPYILDENGFYLGIGNAYPFDSLNILAGDHRLRRTTDGGVSWVVEDSVFPIDYPQGFVNDIDFAGDYGMAAAGPILLYTTPISSNIEDNGNHDMPITVVPNPVMNTAIIRFPQSFTITAAQLRIYDLFGQQIWSSIVSADQSIHEVVIPCHALPSGKYIVEVIAHSKRFSTTIDILH